MRHQATLGSRRAMSVSPLKADIATNRSDVSFVPLSEVAALFDHLISAQQERLRNSQPQSTHEVTNDGTDRSQLSHVANETKMALGVEKRCFH
jgi:hypothetical protein